MRVGALPWRGRSGERGAAPAVAEGRPHEGRWGSEDEAEGCSAASSAFLRETGEYLPRKRPCAAVPGNWTGTARRERPLQGNRERPVSRRTDYAQSSREERRRSSCTEPEPGGRERRASGIRPAAGGSRPTRAPGSLCGCRGRPQRGARPSSSPAQLPGLQVPPAAPGKAGGRPQGSAPALPGEGTSTGRQARAGLGTSNPRPQHTCGCPAGPRGTPRTMPGTGCTEPRRVSRRGRQQELRGPGRRDPHGAAALTRVGSRGRRGLSRARRRHRQRLVQGRVPTLLEAFGGHERVGQLLQRHVVDVRGEGAQRVFQAHQPAGVPWGPAAPVQQSAATHEPDRPQCAPLSTPGQPPCPGRAPRRHLKAPNLAQRSRGRGRGRGRPSGLCPSPMKAQEPHLQSTFPMTVLQS